MHKDLTALHNFKHILYMELRKAFCNHLSIIALMFGIISCIEKGNYNAHYAEIIDHATCVDYLCFLLEGMHPFRPKVETIFVIPIRWLLIHLFLLYAVLYYPYRDLVQSIGSVLVIKMGSRKRWWFSKCLWSYCSNLCGFGIF